MCRPPTARSSFLATRSCASCLAKTLAPRSFVGGGGKSGVQWLPLTESAAKRAHQHEAPVPEIRIVGNGIATVGVASQEASSGSPEIQAHNRRDQTWKARAAEVLLYLRSTCVNMAPPK